MSFRTFRLIPVVLVLVFSLLCMERTAAQTDVTIMDVRVVNAGGGALEVQLRPNATWSSADGLVNLTLTLKWATAVGGAAGAADQFGGGADPAFPAPYCFNTGAKLLEAADGEIDHGGVRYQTYTCIGTSSLGAGCSFAANVWHVYARIPMSGVSGCGANFNVANDAYVIQNNKDYYVSLGGSQLTGAIIGAGVGNLDSDLDATPDCSDGCPLDPNKIASGQCGCGIPDTDTDGDGTANCNDGCPTDPNKINGGVCGCGVSDVDSDGDLTADCIDGCPLDAAKIAPGVCGCGTPDTDSDNDGTANCIDGCPLDPNKISPGTCGCGVPEVLGDVTHDGSVNVADFLVINTAFGTSCTGCAADISGNGVVDVSDFLILNSAWGGSCGN